MTCYSFPSLPSFRVVIDRMEEETPSKFDNNFCDERYLLAICAENRNCDKLLVHRRLFVPRVGDAILIPPYEYHQHCGAGMGYRDIRLHLDPKIVEMLCPNAIACAQIGKNVFRLNSAAKYLSVLEEKDTSFSLATCLSLLTDLEKSSKSEENFNEEEPIPLLLQRSLVFLFSERNQKASGVSLAARYGVSARTVDNLFHEHLGITVGQLSERLRYVKLLELTACGLTDEKIAEALGFKNIRALRDLKRKYKPDQR